MHACCLGRVSGGNTVSCLGVRTSERRRHREERGRSFERLRDRRSVFERRRHECRPGVREQLRLAQWPRGRYRDSHGTAGSGNS